MKTKIDQLLPQLKTIQPKLKPHNNIKQQLNEINKLLHTYSRDADFIAESLRLSIAESFDPKNCNDLALAQYMQKTIANIELEFQEFDVKDFHDPEILKSPEKVKTLIIKLVTKVVPIEYHEEFFKNLIKAAPYFIHDK